MEVVADPGQGDPEGEDDQTELDKGPGNLQRPEQQIGQSPSQVNKCRQDNR